MVEPGREEAAAMRGDHARTARRKREVRGAERIRAQYVLERSLRERLLAAPRADRVRVYGEVYGELFRSLPDHRQHAAAAAAGSRRVRAQVRALRPLVRAGTALMELGCGDGAVAKAMAPHVRQAYGVDVTDELVKVGAQPGNFRFVRSDGVRIDLPDDSIDVAYSNQLIEHLVPEDATAQTHEVARVVKPGGVYLCVTPSRITGPHDISAYFDYEPQGFHLREYDYREMRAMLLAAGFRRVGAYVAVRGFRTRVPFAAMRAVESVVEALPRRLRATLTSSRAAHQRMGVTLIAEK